MIDTTTYENALEALAKTESAMLDLEDAMFEVDLFDYENVHKLREEISELLHFYERLDLSELE